MNGLQYWLALLGTIVVMSSCDLATKSPSDSLTPRIDATFDVAETRMLAVVARLERDGGPSYASSYPVVTAPDDGLWQLKPATDWRSGFFPGVLWELYGHSGNMVIRDAANAWSEGLESLQDMTIDHDLGFRFIPTFGAGLRFQTDLSDPGEIWRNHARDVLQHAALSLDLLFDAGGIPVGALRAFPLSNDYLAPYPVYIDSMMNIELLFEAWDLGGRLKSGPLWQLHEHAVAHADKVLAEHVRPDGSTYHIVQYDETPGPNAGRLHKKLTDQGFANESTWSRGQAWAIYGFTTTYHYTRDDDPVGAQRFLDAAIRLADWFILHLPNYYSSDPYNYTPGDFVPPSDFDAALGEPVGPWNDANGDGILGDRRPGTGTFTARDTSAAVVAAAGLLKLGAIVDDSALRDRYLGAAEDILECIFSLRDPDGTWRYLALDRSSEAILVRGSTAYGRPQQSLSYGDSYFLEALRRCLNLELRDGEVRRCGVRSAF